jgi:hypothetical protein
MKQPKDFIMEGKEDMGQHRHSGCAASAPFWPKPHLATGVLRLATVIFG